LETTPPTPHAPSHTTPRYRTDDMTTTLQPFEFAIDPKVRKAARRAAKQQRKHEAESRRQLDAWERYHALWDAIDLKRKMVDAFDTKAKLALTIMGALNAAVFVLLFRGAGAVSLPLALRPWFAGLLIVYGVVTFGFIVQAIEALRPRLDPRTHALEEMHALGLEAEPSAEVVKRPPSRFFALDATPPSLEEELEMWGRVGAREVSAELVVMNRGANDLVLRQVAALERVYRSLKALLVLAFVILSLAATTWALNARG
jgi:hypothetical protein